MFDLKRPDHFNHPDWLEAKWNISGLFSQRVLLSHVLKLMKNFDIAHEGANEGRTLQ